MSGSSLPAFACKTDEEFLARLRELAENWRYSDEFIGLIVRQRWPRNYDAPVEE